MGHVTLTYALKRSLGDGAEFYKKVVDIFARYLRTQHDDDNPELLPWINKIPLGATRYRSGGYPTGVFYVEAYWCNNYYMKTEDPSNQRCSWIADLLPQCPLYQVIHGAWRSTIAYFFKPEYTRQLIDRKEVMIPPLKENLHGPIHSTYGDAILTPISGA